MRLTKRRVHGKRGTGAYTSWQAMKNRCNNPNQAKGYFGKRTVCERWSNSFQEFFSDMGERPSGTSIDRIDNRGNYSCGKCEHCIANGWKANCRWATPQEQMRNSSHVRIIEIDGVSKPLVDWIEHFGLSAAAFHDRLKRGMSEVEALTSEKTVRAGESHPRHKLTISDVREIRELLKTGESHRSIAQKFNVVRSTVSAISRKTLWGNAV